jgi:ribosome biogenesis GTPase
MIKEGSGNIGRVIGVYGPRVDIAVEGRVVSSSVRGKLKYGARGKSLVAVGDYVQFSIESIGDAAIEEIRQRTRVISRPAVEKGSSEQVIVSNVDRMIIVTSIQNPEFKPGVVDRFLIIAFKADISPIIVINKIDLGAPEDYAEYIEDWKGIGCEVIRTSALTGENLDLVAGIIGSGTSVVVGHSGVGKSSLLNKLNPDLDIKIGDVSLYSGKGIHTTSRVNLFEIFENSWVADTPGLKDLGLVGISKKNLHRYYPEFALSDSKCQFNDCVHITEPSCAVKKAVYEGNQSISRFRYQNYVNIYESLDK